MDTKLVMIIDDSIVVRKILEVAMKRAGIPYISYPDGTDAIRALAARQDLVPDLVFLDIGMPQMGGYKVAQLLRGRKRFSKTVIVILSGRTGVLDRLKGRLAGAQSYLTKPFTRQDIETIVQTYLPAAAP